MKIDLIMAFQKLVEYEIHFEIELLTIICIEATKDRDGARWGAF